MAIATGSASLSPSDWVAIGLFVAGGVGVFVWWVWHRFVSTVDGLHQDIHGKNGPFSELAKSVTTVQGRLSLYVLHEEFDVEMSEFMGQFTQLHKEGLAREANILKAIERMDKNLWEEIRGLRSDLSGTNKRIDQIKDQQTARRSRPS